MNWQDVLLPLAPAAFLADAWEQRTVHLRAPGRSWDGLGVTSATLEEAATRLHARVAWTDADGEHHSRPASGPLRAIAPGETACISRVERAFPRVEALGRALREGLGVGSDVYTNAYWSPSGAGFSWHFDPQAVFVLQVEGRKRWRTGAVPAVPWPPAEGGGTPRRRALYARSIASSELPPPEEATVVEHVLEPGDVLFLPAGTWHTARAEGTPSLGLTVSIPPLTPWDLLLVELLGDIAAEPAWRRDLPPSASPPPGPMPTETLAALQARVADLRARLDALTPARLHAAWRASRASTAPLPESGAPGPDAVLAHRAGAPGYELDGDDIVLLHGGVQLTLPAELAGLVERLAGTPRFRAEEAAGWVDGEWDDVAPLLAVLVREGVLAVEG